MLTYNDIKKLLTSDYIKKPENDHQFVEQLDIYFEPDFITRKKRIDYMLKLKETDINSLPLILKNLPDYESLEEWLFSGYSYIQQCYFYYLLVDSEIYHKEKNDSILRKISNTKILSFIYDMDAKNNSFSKQEIIFIKSFLGRHFGITSNYKYDLMKELINADCIEVSTLENIVDDDDKINKLMQLFFNNPPYFSTDLRKNADEYVKFIHNLDDSKYEIKWTEFANQLFITKVI